MIVTHDDARAFGYCNAGLRKWFPRDGVTFDDFRQHGVTASGCARQAMRWRPGWPMKSNRCAASASIAGEHVNGRRRKGGGSSSYVVGHRYYAGLHLAICHGPVDAVTRIIVGERTAWSGSVTSSQTLYVNARNCSAGIRARAAFRVTSRSSWAGRRKRYRAICSRNSAASFPAFRGWCRSSPSSASCRR